jgi:hypothetical protein
MAPSSDTVVFLVTFFSFWSLCVGAGILLILRRHRKRRQQIQQSLPP